MSSFLYLLHSFLSISLHMARVLFAYRVVPECDHFPLSVLSIRDTENHLVFPFPPEMRLSMTQLDLPRTSTGGPE